MLCIAFDQGLSQELETGCLKLAIVKFLGVQISKGDQNILISTINMYIFIKMRHDIRIQGRGNYMMMKKINHMLEIDILRNSLGVLRGAF